MPAIRTPPSTPLPFLRRRAWRARHCRRRKRTGRRSWASSSSIGMLYVARPDPFGVALDFGFSAIRHACALCDFDPVLPPAPKERRPRSSERRCEHRVSQLLVARRACEPTPDTGPHTCVRMGAMLSVVHVWFPATSRSWRRIDRSGGSTTLWPGDSTAGRQCERYRTLARRSAVRRQHSATRPQRGRTQVDGTRKGAYRLGRIRNVVEPCSIHQRRWSA